MNTFFCIDQNKRNAENLSSHKNVHPENFDDQMKVGTSAQAEPEIHDDNEFSETVVDLEACGLQNSAINSDAEQLKLITLMRKKCCWMMYKKTLQHNNNKSGRFESMGI
uniref:Uncharacterized protein n=1 Tax=Romanomermis culicivorax TaxID=13658 RepID=A0A915JXJ6_ROMCU